MLKKLQSTSFALLLLLSVAGLKAPPASAKQCFTGASAGYVRPRLGVGARGRSLTTVKIRNQPGTNSQVLGTLRSGNTFKVIAGPQCTEGYVWWQVNNGSIIGWVAEADPATFRYWLEPIR